MKTYLSFTYRLVHLIHQNGLQGLHLFKQIHINMHFCIYISLGKIIATYLLHCNMWHCTSSLLGIGFHCPHSRSSRKTCMCDGQDCSNNGDSDRNIPLAFLEDSKLVFLLKTVKKNYISKIVSTTGWQHYLKACIVS